MLFIYLFFFAQGLVVLSKLSMDSLSALVFLGYMRSRPIMPVDKKKDQTMVVLYFSYIYYAVPESDIVFWGVNCDIGFQDMLCTVVMVVFSILDEL